MCEGVEGAGCLRACMRRRACVCVGACLRACAYVLPEASSHSQFGSHISPVLTHSPSSNEWHEWRNLSPKKAMPKRAKRERKKTRKMTTWHCACVCAGKREGERVCV